MTQPRPPTERRKTRRIARRGMIAVAFIILLVLLQIVIVGVVVTGARDQTMTVRRLEAARAKYASEAAAQIAIRELANKADEDGDGTIGSTIRPSFANGGFTATATSNSDGLVIAAAGTSGQARSNAAFNYILSAPAAAGTVAGVWTEAYAPGSAINSINDIAWGTPAWVGVQPWINIQPASAVSAFAGGPTTNFAVRYTGTLNIPAAGTWTFSTTSDDGSVLYINGIKVVDNDGAHAPLTKSGNIILPAGPAAIEVRFWQAGGGWELSVTYSGPGVAANTPIPSSRLTCTPPIARPTFVADGTIALIGNSTKTNDFADAYDGRANYGGSNIYTNRHLFATNTTSAGSVMVTQTFQVNGNITCGPGGTPGTAITTATSGTITGTRTASAQRWLIMNPGFNPASIASSGAYTQSSGNTTLSTNARYTSMTLSGSSTVRTISGNVIIVVDGDLTISGGSQISMSTTSTLTMFVGGNIVLSGSSKINNSSGPQNPLRCKIFMTGSSKSITLTTGSAIVQAEITNPRGGMAWNMSNTNTPVYAGKFLGTTIAMTGRVRMRGDISDTVAGTMPPPTPLLLQNYRPFSPDSTP